MRSVRIATALYLALALPGLVFGWLARAAPLGLPCDPTGEIVDLLGSGTARVASRAAPIDYAVLYWLIPAMVLLTIGVGIQFSATP